MIVNATQSDIYLLCNLPHRIPMVASFQEKIESSLDDLSEGRFAYGNFFINHNSSTQVRTFVHIIYIFMGFVQRHFSTYSSFEIRKCPACHFTVGQYLNSRCSVVRRAPSPATKLCRRKIGYAVISAAFCIEVQRKRNNPVPDVRKRVSDSRGGIKYR